MNNNKYKFEQINESENVLAGYTQTQAKFDLKMTEQYHNLFKHAKDSLIVFDPVSMEIFDVNDKACRTYCISREDFIGRSFSEVSQLKREKISLLMEGKEIEEFEDFYQRPNDMPIYFLTDLSVIEYKNQQAILSINHDISKQKWIEWKIIRTEQEWKETVDSISDMIIIEDSHSRLQRCNKATRDFFSVRFPEIIGQKICELFPCSHTGKLTIPDPLHDQTMGKAWETQFPNRCDWFEVTKHPLPQEMGGWVHIIKNITKRKLAEQEMQRLKTGIEQADDAVVIADCERIIQYVNPAFQKLTGWSKTESIGCDFLAIHGFPTSSVTYHEIVRTVVKGNVWRGHCEAQMKDGTVYYAEATISPVKNESGQIINFVTVSRDITEKRRFESIAEAVNMMENVGYVFSGIRHELGNPVNSLKTALSVLKKNIDQWNHDQVVKYIDRSMVEIGRIEYLLRSLKTFSMHEDPEVQKVQILPFIERFFSFVNTDFTAKGIKLDYLIDTEADELMADTRALHQILLNVLSNASDAVKDRENPSIKILVDKIASVIEIKVIDNGIGLNEQQQANLFKPFYTSKPNGTGLGFIIVKKLMAKMNGTVKVESQLNVGTKVILSLEAAPIE